MKEDNSEVFLLLESENKGRKRDVMAATKEGGILLNLCHSLLFMTDGSS